MGCCSSGPKPVTPANADGGASRQPTPMGTPVADGRPGPAQPDPVADRPAVFLDVAIGEDQRRIVIQLFTDKVPRTCENFVGLCEGSNGKSLQDSTFHRVLPGELVQGGDITEGDGSGGASVWGGAFDDENFSVLHDAPGIVSMANTGPNTNTSQFVITMKPMPTLDGKHVAFGVVTEGLDALELMSRLGTDTGDTTDDIVVEKCGRVPPPTPQPEQPQLQSAPQAQ